FIDFHLPPVPKWTEYHQSTIFGLACFRQIASSELLNKSADVTRSSVQKAVVILATEPVLGSIRTTLRLVTQALFAQRDFTKMDILENLYESLQNSVSGSISEANLYSGMNAFDRLNFFQSNFTSKVLFFGHKVERLSSFQYSLISFFPDLLRNLEDVGSPALSYHPVREFELGSNPDLSRQKPSNRHIYLVQGTFFQPYIPLQQIDVLLNPTTKSFLVGSSNAIFLHNKSCGIDAIVNVDNGTIEITDAALNSAISLTGADRRFMDGQEDSIPLCLTSLRDNKKHDPTLSSQISFEGSDDDIRARFETYLLRLLASVKYSTQPLPIPETIEGSVSPDVLSEFNVSWVKAWQQTQNYKIWNERVNVEVATSESIGHPKEGTSAIALFQSSVAQKFQEFSKTMSSPAPDRASELKAEKSYQLSRSMREYIALLLTK
ncbi:transport protein Avl9-domain-containing protein, partial [Chytridium lagenaria]